MSYIKLLPEKGFCICYRTSATLMAAHGTYNGVVFWTLDGNLFCRPDGPATTWYASHGKYLGFIKGPSEKWAWRRFPPQKIKIRFTKDLQNEN